ncbi:MAG: hypothetical protein ACRDST_01645 [Pseudonocardiaceae bacterium]
MIGHLPWREDPTEAHPPGRAVPLATVPSESEFAGLDPTRGPHAVPSIEQEVGGRRAEHEVREIDHGGDVLGYRLRVELPTSPQVTSYYL